MSSAINEQVEQLKQRFMALQARERIIVICGAVLVLLVGVYTSGLAPLYKAVNERTVRVTQKQQDLAWMQNVAPQLSALSNKRPVNSTESLVVVIASTAGRANIGSALTGQTPNGNNSVRVRLEGVQFDALVLWLGMLQTEFGIGVDTADINRSSQPGQVNAGLTLTRSGA